MQGAACRESGMAHLAGLLSLTDMLSTHSCLCSLLSMSLYPSLEDLKVDKVIKVRRVF